MKALILLSACLLFFTGKTATAQTTGGPDTFGYHWANDQDTIPAAPVYNWIDIKDTANKVDGLGDDNSAGPFDLGFYIGYYGQWHNNIWIGSNGFISFQNAGNLTAPFPVIPTPTAPDNIIAAFLSDLTLKGSNNDSVPGAAVYFRTNGVDTAIIQYDSVPFWDTSSLGYSGRNTFQILLLRSDNSITFQYKQLLNSTPSYDLVNTGLKIGIEDQTGNDGLQVLDTFPADSSAIKFFYPGYFSTNDLNKAGLTVGQNYPNPAEDRTTISYSLQKTGEIKISVQNILGEQMDAFTSGKIQAGDHSWILNIASYAPGIYFYSLSAHGFTTTRKMVIVK